MAEIEFTVRYFAAAGAAAGRDEEQLTVPSGATVDDVVAGLGNGNAGLRQVLPRCSFLVDGVAVRDHRQVLSAGDTLDVLPPFAGG